ncbi:MAG: hypothetical protein ACKVQW_09635 [Pyrinomonadaceae bacterium]
MDERWGLGGIGCYIKQQREKQSKSPTSGRAHRTALAKETVTITTGFAAILFFSTVRFHNDLQTVNHETYTTLVTVALLFSIVCVLNLIQLLVLRLLDYRWFPRDLQQKLNRKLRLLNIWSWHSLVTAFVLVLLLLQSPLPALSVNALYSCCVFWYYFNIVSDDAVVEQTNNG